MREARGPEWTGWLAEQGIVGLSGIDTRSLVLRLREGGSLRAAAVAAPLAEDEALEAVRATPAMTGAALVAHVSTAAPYVYLGRRARCGSPSSTTAASARSCAGWPAAGAP